VEVTPRRIEYYYAPDGGIPFREWFGGLKDDKVRLAIDRRLIRVEQGLLGDCRSLGHGVFELRIDLGPGYRIYFGQQGRIVILLLCGGDKKSQEKDIKNAYIHWEDYLRRG